MDIYTNLSSHFVQLNVLGDYLSETSQKYLKIAAVALGIITAAAAAYYVYTRFFNKKNDNPRKVIQRPVVQAPTPPVRPVAPVAPAPVYVPPQRPTPPVQRPDPIVDKPRVVPAAPRPPVDVKPQPPKPQKTEDDEWARAIQAADEADRMEQEILEQVLKDSLKDSKDKHPVPAKPAKPAAPVAPAPAPAAPAKVIDTPDLSKVDTKPDDKKPAPEDKTPSDKKPDDKESGDTKKDDKKGADDKLPDDVKPFDKPPDDLIVLVDKIIPVDEKPPVDVPPIDPPKPVDVKKDPKVPVAPFSKQVDELMDKVSANVFTNSSFSTQKAFKVISSQTNQEILGVLLELVAEYERRYPQFRKIGYGEPVDHYNANVDNPGLDVKYLTLVSLPNLLKYGQRIIDDFTKFNFLGGAHHYGHNSGLNLFATYTGNTVDLDTELDVETEQEALAKAREKIVEFGKRCGLVAPKGGELTAEEVARQMPRRKLELPQPHMPYIHQAQLNTDRSNYGIWSRINPRTKKLCYFVNVPNCDVILSATLRFPYMLAELAWRAKDANHGTFSKEFLDDFFTRGLSEMCFNQKIMTFSTFHAEWMAKFDGGVETAEETARRKVLSGEFGIHLKLMGPDLAIKTALSRGTLFNVLSDFDLEKNGRALDQWLKEETDGIIAKLTQKGLWETYLYRAEEPSADNTQGSDYFLLDKASLVSCLKAYYEAYLKYS